MENNKPIDYTLINLKGKTTRLAVQEVLHSPRLLWLTWGASGLLRPAPGTWGSLAALPLLLPILAWGGGTLLLITAALLYIISIFVVHRHEQISGDHDESYIVVDEVIGMAITLSAATFNPIDIITGFLLFRVFDAIKPSVIGDVDRHVSGAHGVLLDDVLAGLLSALCLVILHAWVG